MRIIKADKKGVQIAVDYLCAGKSVVYPTDTAYGLGVDATNASAARQLYRIKERDRKKPVHIVVADLKMAKRYAKFSGPAERLFKKFLPGPLTLVLALRAAARSLRTLSGRDGTIGIRTPKSATALTLVKKLGKPVTTTSANPAGGLTPYSIKASLRQFQKKEHQPDLFLDAGRLPRRKPSTIVAIQRNKILILRKGPISKKEIVKVVSSKL